MGTLLDLRGITANSTFDRLIRNTTELLIDYFNSANATRGASVGGGVTRLLPEPYHLVAVYSDVNVQVH